MNNQELFTDLAMAEMNAKKIRSTRKIVFLQAVRDAFVNNNVNSFFDLVVNNAGAALTLKELALEEKLL